MPVLAELFATETSAHWLALLERHGVPCGPINTLKDTFENEQVVARGMQDGGAGTFTLLLASMGSGAIVSTAFLPQLRRTYARDALVMRGSLLQSAAMAVVAANGAGGRPLAALLDEIEAAMKGEGEAPGPAVHRRLADKAEQAARDLFPQQAAFVPDLVFWVGAVGRGLRQHARDRTLHADAPQALADCLSALARQAREMALAMDFAFLLDADTAHRAGE